MWVVTLTKPLPGVRATVFVFFTQAEADEFQSCVHASHQGAETALEEAGEATDVFESWSF